MQLNAELIEGFSGMYLSRRYDEPQPTPEWHRDGWELYCSSYSSCACAAPRGHAKSTALTHDFALANVCFDVESYVIIVGSSEEMAVEHLGDIANEFRENDDLIRDFHIRGFVQDQKTDIIIERTDRTQFRILARGAEQKIRGRKWRGKRPGLIICDDLEDDEQVESKDRRKKFRKWFFRALKPALRDGGRIRVHGTILHKDSLLMHVMHNITWHSLLYKAHASFSDFSKMLWPEKFSEVDARAKRQEMIEEGDTAGYAQEYLNDPRDDESNYLLVEDFLPMKEEDREVFMSIGIGCDFAVSKADSANRTAFVVGGKRIDNRKAVFDCRAGRWDTKEWIDLMFELEARWHPENWFVEDGVIWKAVWPTIREEMRIRDIYLTFVPTLPVKDKATRGTPLRKQMRAGVWMFDKKSSWYAEYEEELLDFSATAEAILDDVFDATVTLCRGFDELSIEEGDEMDDEEIAFERESRRLRAGGEGKSLVTGY